MRYISFAFLSQRTRASLFRRFGHSKHFLLPPVLGLFHTRNSMQSPMPRPPTPDGVRHVDKKPRLDLAEEPTNGLPDGPVQRAVLDRGKDKTEDGWKKLSKRTARKAKKQKHALPEPYSNEHVIQLEIKELLGESTVETAEAEGREWSPPFENKTELELTVSALSSTGTYASPPALTAGFTLFQGVCWMCKTSSVGFTLGHSSGPGHAFPAAVILRLHMPRQCSNTVAF